MQDLFVFKNPMFKESKGSKIENRNEELCCNFAL